jgi:phosphohistidine phosphatase SixA
MKTEAQIKHAKAMNAARVQRWRERQLDENGFKIVQIIIPESAIPEIRALERQLRKGAKLV